MELLFHSLSVFLQLRCSLKGILEIALSSFKSSRNEFFLLFQSLFNPDIISSDVSNLFRCALIIMFNTIYKLLLQNSYLILY